MADKAGDFTGSLFRKEDKVWTKYHVVIGPYTMSLLDKEGGSVTSFSILERMVNFTLSPLGAGHFEIIYPGDRQQVFRVPEDSYWTQDLWLEELTVRAKRAKEAMGTLFDGSVKGDFEHSDDEGPEQEAAGDEDSQWNHVGGGYVIKLKKKCSPSGLLGKVWSTRIFTLFEKREMKNIFNMKMGLEVRHTSKDDKPRNVIPLEAISEVFATTGGKGVSLYFTAGTMYNSKHLEYELESEKGPNAILDWVGKLIAASIKIREAKLEDQTEKANNKSASKGAAKGPPLGGGGKKKGSKPKVVLVGLDQAGKSVLAQALRVCASPRDPAICTPSVAYTLTVGFSAHTLQAKNKTIELIDVGGLDQIREMWPRYFHECDAVVFVVDSTDQVRMDRDRNDNAQTEFDSVLASSELKNVPILVVASKQGVPGAVPPDQVVARVAKGRKVEVLGADSINGLGVTEVLTWLATNA